MPTDSDYVGQIARLTAERDDAIARAEQAEAALAYYRDGQWRGGAAVEGLLLAYARACFIHNKTRAAPDRAAALALYDEVAPRLDADDPRRRTVEELRALLTGGHNAD